MVIEELSQWREKIISESNKYDKIVREWVRNRLIYEQKIKQYNDRIIVIRNQIEEIIMERISDRKHAEVYNNMIAKREEQISDLEKKISDCKIYDKISKERHAQLKSTAEMIDEILDKGELSDTQLRTLVHRIVVHQNEDKSLDVRLEFNGDFDDSCRFMWKVKRHRDEKLAYTQLYLMCKVKVYANSFLQNKSKKVPKNRDFSLSNPIKIDTMNGVNK